uniref:Recep_L_domain domain-containing protein n=1 Tax=Panagrellus redivivus TaxID=6233 RepID=A0A7E4UMY6_PANRE
MSAKHAIKPCLENDCVNKASVDCEIPLDTHNYNSLQSSITMAPTNVSVWKRFCSVIKFYLAVIIPGDECLNKDSVDCESYQNVPLFSRATYDQVFITDSDEIYQWASKDTLMFRLFKCFERYSVFRFFLGGLISINPCWRSVLWVDEVINKSEPVEITDTLILHCNSIEIYSKVIPRIRGSYHRLILHGHISWDQIKQLIHPGVKQIRINAKFDMKPDEHDEFVFFIRRHCCGMECKFSVAYEAKCPMDLLKKIYKTFDGSRESHCILHFSRGCDIIHSLLLLVYVFLCYLVIFVPAGFFFFMSFYFELDNDYGVFGFVIFIIDVIVAFCHMVAAPSDVKNNVRDKDFINTMNYLSAP